MAASARWACNDRTTFIHYGYIGLPVPTLLITVDALRADHLGQYGYHRDTMPVLDEIVEGGTVFESAFSNAPYTRISVPSLHTSRYLAYDQISQLDTIASILSASGVRTAAIGTQTGADMIDGDLGFDTNADLGRDDFHRQANGSGQYYAHRAAKYVERCVQWSDSVYSFAKRVYDRLQSSLGSGFVFLGYQSAERVSSRVVKFLRDQPDGNFFLWIHYMEAHRPYGVHDQNPAYVDRELTEEQKKELIKIAATEPDQIDSDRRRLLTDLYDSDLRYCSAQLSTVFEELQSQGYWEDANVMFTSDHGTELGEHGRYWHTNLGYDELLHVPLLVMGNTGTEARVSQQRELLDVTPTICGFHGIDTEEYAFQGRPLDEDGEREVIALGSADPSFDRPIAARWGRWKYIYEGNGTALYDLESDPAEEQSVTADHPSVVSAFESAIPEFLFDRTEEELREPIDYADEKQLEALGYL